MRRNFIFLAALFWFYTVISQTTLNEGFESWPPSGWQIHELGVAMDGWRDDYQGLVHTGTGSAFSSIDNNQSDNWLVSPGINVVNGTYELNYWEINQDIDYYYSSTILISSNSNNPSSGDFIEVYEANSLNTEAWEKRTIDLSAYEGQFIYVAFRHQGDGPTWHSWTIDDVNVGPSSFTDGALSQFINPIGVSENPTIEPINIRMQNLGTTTINDFNITWDINSVVQPTYSVTSLNLLPGQTTMLTIGLYNFSGQGAYNIKTVLNLTDDFDDSNNQLQNTFEISPFQDGALIGITPEGIYPKQGTYDVKATVSNLGDNLINSAEIIWSVDGMVQIPFTTSSLNLAPGETITLILGQYNFAMGLHDISATLNVFGDIVSSNDQYNSNVSFETFYESFEGNVFPPEGWSINFGTKDGINFDTPVDGEYYYVSNVDDNYFGQVTDTIFTPLLNIKNGDHFRFYIKSNPAQLANHSLIWKNGTTGEINFIQNIANSSGFSSWELRDINISAAAGINYIGILNTSSGKYGETKYDLFTSDAKLHQFDHDLKILNGDIYFMAKQNVSQKFECKIRNAGVLPVLGSEYTLKLMASPNVELASINGVDLDNWQETTLTINYTFSELAEMRLYFKIEYAADQNLSNNIFREYNLSIVPSTIEINNIGSPEIQNGNLPFTPNGNTQTLGEDDMTEMLFYNTEFSSPGYVYGVAYKYDNLLNADKVVHYPLKVWIAQIPETNLDGGWLPKEKLTLVYDGTVEILPGNNRDLYIPFNEPILINGIENVVIKSYQYDPEWPPSIFRFLSTNLSDGPTRTIGTSDYYELNPDDTSTEYFSSPNFAYSRFIIDPSGLKSELSGEVYNNVTKMPIANATISIEGSEISVQSNANGSYVLPKLPYGNYNIKASYNGFYDNVLSVNLNSDKQTQDFFLDPLNEIQVTGRVFGNNNISTPLNQVEISILKDNNLVQKVSTNTNGDFIFPVVYSGSDYEVKVFMYGYYQKTIPISPDTDDINLGDIYLDQEFISPFDVIAEPGSKPIINWKSPKLSKKVQLKKDKNIRSFDLTNSPNEDVWIGNFFTLASTTTLTSVEIQTGVYQNATDYVTIDIFDLESLELLATSEPFLIYKDSLQTIDIPNIVVDKTILAMVHWKDNAASTNTLTLDYSDPNIANGAMIMYPGGQPQLLSVFFGQYAPKMSCLLRVNTLDDGNPITNTEALRYNVYRGLASDFPNISNWNKINLLPLSTLSYVDNNKNGFNPLDYYRYAVETIYNNGYSEVTYSNTISGDVLGFSNDEIIESQILIYPVPAKDKVTIKFGANMRLSKPLEVFDMLGKKILVKDQNEISNGMTSLDVNTFQSGIYIMKLEVNGVLINKKFIVE